MYSGCFCGCTFFDACALGVGQMREGLHPHTCSWMVPVYPKREMVMVDVWLFTCIPLTPHMVERHMATPPNVRRTLSLSHELSSPHCSAWPANPHTYPPHMLRNNDQGSDCHCTHCHSRMSSLPTRVVRTTGRAAYEGMHIFNEQLHVHLQT